MKLLLKYLKQYKKSILAVFVLAVVSQTFNFLNPYFLGKYLIDPFAENVNYFRTHNLISDYFNGLYRGILYIFFGSTIYWVTSAYQNNVLQSVILKLKASLYIDVQRHLLRLHFKEFEEYRSGALLFTLQKAQTDVEKLLASFVNIFITALVGLVVIIVVTIKLSIWIPILYLIGISSVFVMTNLITKKFRAIQQDILNENNDFASSLNESIRNIELVKSLNLIEKESDRLEGKIKGILGIELFKLKKIRNLGLIYAAFSNSIHQAVIFILMIFLLYDKITIGQLLMMQLYYYYVFGTLELLGSVFVSLREAESSMDSMSSLLKKPSVELPKPKSKTLPVECLEFKKVSFKYDDKSKFGLHDVSFRVKKGESIAIVGPSGAGKTTLLKLLLGLYEPTKGQIISTDSNGNKIELDELRSQLGLVSQNSQFFSGSIRDNLIFVNDDVDEKRLFEVLDRVRCREFINRSEKGIDAVIGEGGLMFSGGERQRLSIARALIRNSNLLIFDEATTSLDVITETEIVSTIREISKESNYLTFIISHKLSNIKFANHILVIENGRIIEEGTHSRLLLNKGLYSSMWRQQNWQEYTATS